MRRTLVVLAVGLLLVGLLGAPATAGPRGHGAGKAQMYPGTWSCAKGATPISGQAAHGFVVMNLTANGTLIGTLHLKGAMPGKTYDVYIAGTNIPVPGTAVAATCPATPRLGTLTTNRAGNGSFTFKVKGVPAQSAVWVIVEGTGLTRLQSQAIGLSHPRA